MNGTAPIQCVYICVNIFTYVYTNMYVCTIYVYRYIIYINYKYISKGKIYADRDWMMCSPSPSSEDVPRTAVKQQHKGL